MRVRGVLLFCLIMELLLFLSFSQPSNTLIVSSAFYFEGFYQRTTQENHGDIFASNLRTNCRITILEEIIQGSHYSVNFQGYVGYDYYLTNVFLNTNSSVNTSNNIMSFELNTYDPDGNNRSQPFNIENTPSSYPISECNIFLVNPNWNAHTPTWALSVENMQQNWCVNCALSTAFTNGMGKFQYSIVVNVEDSLTIAGNSQDFNGTTTFSFISSYDTDGVLIQYSYETSTYYYEDNNALKLTSLVTYTRVTTIPLITSIYPFVLSQLILTAIVLVIGVSIGFWVGKRQRRPQTESSE